MITIPNYLNLANRKRCWQLDQTRTRTRTHSAHTDLKGIKQLGPLGILSDPSPRRWGCRLWHRITPLLRPLINFMLSVISCSRGWHGRQINAESATVRTFRQLGTVENWRPVKVEPSQDRFTLITYFNTHWLAGGYRHRFIDLHRAHWCIHGTQEELEEPGTPELHQWYKLVHLQQYSVCHIPWIQASVMYTFK